MATENTTTRDAVDAELEDLIESMTPEETAKALFMGEMIRDEALYPGFSKLLENIDTNPGAALAYIDKYYKASKGDEENPSQ